MNKLQYTADLQRENLNGVIVHMYRDWLNNKLEVKSGNKIIHIPVFAMRV